MVERVCSCDDEHCGGNLGMGPTTLISMKLSNTAKKISDEEYQWDLLLDAGRAAPLIAHLVLNLHPTFPENRLEVKDRTDDGVFVTPSFTGWGTFTVMVEIHWVDGSAMAKVEHKLAFASGGSSTDVQVGVPITAEMAEAQHAAPTQQEEAARTPSPALGGSTSPVPAPSGPTLDRGEFIRGLGDFVGHTDPLHWHGRGYKGPMNPPTQTWKSTKKPRSDHAAPDWLTASEFEEKTEVLDVKVKILANMLRCSTKTVVYSGAGISRAAGIGQAALGAVASQHKTTDAVPTFTHYALGALARKGLIHGWVQQNHDGLPQKAGFPQECINEIHGSWYDPSNPVVKYSGTLKSDCFPWMQDDANTADLVLVVGTSLGGLNADQVAIKAASRSTRGKSIGFCMINLQQTEQDGKATLRIFGQSDMVLRRVIHELGMKRINQKPAVFKKEARVLVPYDQNGDRSDTCKMWLDLRPGAKVKLTDGHNVQGAKQPMYMHIGAPAGVTQYKGRKCGPGHGQVAGWCNDRVAIYLTIESERMTLGQWWLEAAERGGPKSLPVVNLRPQMET